MQQEGVCPIWNAIDYLVQGSSINIPYTMEISIFKQQLKFEQKGKLNLKFKSTFKSPLIDKIQLSTTAKTKYKV